MNNSTLYNELRIKVEKRNEKKNGKYENELQWN